MSHIALLCGMFTVTMTTFLKISYDSFFSGVNHCLSCLISYVQCKYRLIIEFYILPSTHLSTHAYINPSSYPHMPSMPFILPYMHLRILLSFHSASIHPCHKVFLLIIYNVQWSA